MNFLKIFLLLLMIFAMPATSMQESKITAVITGAASGIGKGIAFHCVQEGMNVVLADIEKTPLYELEKELIEKGARVLAVVTDVSKESSVKALADIVFETFGEVHYLFSNAGVSGPFGPVWEIPLEQIKWTIDVNLMGSVHLIQAFIPRMLKQPKSEHGHIVITSSHLGLTSKHSLGSYAASKHALVALAESTQEDLKNYGSNINVSVFFPFFVQSALPNSGRHRDEGLFITEKSRELLDELTKLTEQGITPAKAAELLFKGLKKKEHYIFTDSKTKEAFSERALKIVR